MIVKQIILGAAAGGILSLAFAPISSFIALVGAVLLLLSALEEAALGKRCCSAGGSGAAFVYVHLLTGLYWVSSSFDASPAIVEQFGWAKPITVFGLPLALMWPQVMGCALTVWIGRQVKGWQGDNPMVVARMNIDSTATTAEAAGAWRGFFAAIFAYSWVLSEGIRSYYLEPFPWLLMGQAAAGYSVIVMQAVELLGVDGLGFMTLLVATIPYVRTWRWLGLIGGVALLLLVWSWQRYKHFEEQGERGVAVNAAAPIAVMMVQAGVEFPPMSREEKLAALRDIIAITKQGQREAHREYDGRILIIWPESALQFAIEHQAEHLDLAWGDAAYDDILVTGADRYQHWSMDAGEGGRGDKAKLQAATRFYNSLIVVTTDGRIIATYDKINLAPFGEYMPWKSFLAKLAPLSVAENEFVAGQPPQYLDLGAGFEGRSIIPYICYDIGFKEWFNSQPELGAVAVQITNDLWFGDSSGPHQHLLMAQIKAVQLRRYLFRAANRGVSAVINPRGEILKKLSADTSGAEFYLLK